MIDTAKNAVDHWIPMPGVGYGTAPTPDGRWLVVALPRASKVAVIDLRDMTVAHILDVPRAPQEVLVRAGRGGGLRLVRRQQKGRRD